MKNTIIICLSALVLLAAYSANQKDQQIEDLTNHQQENNSANHINQIRVDACENNLSQTMHLAQDAENRVNCLIRLVNDPSVDCRGYSDAHNQFGETWKKNMGEYMKIYGTGWVHTY